MKKTVLMVAALVSVMSFAYAQKPAAGSKGFTAGLGGGITGPVGTAGFTKTVMFKYMLNEKMTARVGVNFGNLPGTGKVIVDSTAGAPQTTTETSGSAWALDLGGQYSLGGNEKLDVFASIDVVLGGTMGSKTVVTTDYLKDMGGFKMGDKSEATTVPASSMTYGVLAGVGFDYFFAANLAVGAELNYGYVSTGTSGGSTKTTSTKGGTTTTVETKVVKAMTSSGGLGAQGGTITLSWFF